MHEPFVQNAAPGAVLSPCRLIDRTFPWARSLLLGVDTHTPQPNAPVPASLGNVIFQVSGLCQNGAYNRRFALQQYGSIELDVSGFSGLKVYVIESTVPGAGAFGWLSERAYTAIRPARAWLPETGAAGDHTTPWGASSFLAGMADPGFTWNADVGGTVIAIADPVALGDVHQVRAPCYSTSVPFVGIWEISL